jgi:hypothetical protein
MEEGGRVMREGGCLCGSIRYVAAGEPVSVSICHCASCRKSAGAPSVAWAVYARDELSIVKGELTIFASSPGVQRGHCSACGTYLTFFEVGEDTIDVAVVSLDDPNQLVPTKEIWLSRCLDWEVLSPDRTHFNEGSG